MNPKLYVLARPFPAQDFNKFLAAENLEWRRSPATDAEQLVEFAGRMCYLSFGARQSNKSNCEYIQNLIKHGHDSVLEHVNWTFLLTGVSRAFTHQLVRHRVGFAFSQLSQQYHDESDASFVVPASLDESPKALNAWHKAIEVSRPAYREILSLERRCATIDDEAQRVYPTNPISRSQYPPKCDRDENRSNSECSRTSSLSQSSWLH